MKKAFLVVMLTLAAATAFGVLGQVVASFTIPGASACAGLARSNGYLYSTYYSGSVIMRADADTGSLYGSFTSPGGTNTRGLAYGFNSHLYVNKAYSAPYTLYDLNESSGSIYASYAVLPSTTTHGSAVRCTGDGGSGTDAIFLTNYSNDMVYVCTTTGSISSSFSAAAATTFYEIAYDWRNQLIWGAMNSPVVVHGINTSGSIVSSFTSTASNSYGMTYHGSYLWLGTTSGLIYKIHCPLSNVNIAPTSLGRVKAIYK